MIDLLIGFACGLGGSIVGYSLALLVVWSIS